MLNKGENGVGDSKTFPLVTKQKQSELEWGSFIENVEDPKDKQKWFNLHGQNFDR